jgi:tetratricopeptide (TPR) repeat protein
MSCDISGEQLWSWIDNDAPELGEHLAVCSVCRERAAKIREDIGIFAADAAEEIPFPEKIGPYAIKRLLGEGGQALVFEAEQPSPRRHVALKVLKGGYLVDKTRLRHFRRETQALARLNHPAIATIYEAGRTPEGLHYFAMELVNGAPLDSFLKKKKPNRRKLLELFLGVCGAIQYAHEEGVIHRDLKPSNIMVGVDGQPKILDFGLVRLTHSELMPTFTATKDGRVEGTPRYMSPEQALGLVKKIDSRSDVYALGVILYEMLTGRPPSDVTLITPESIRTICEVMPRKPSVVNPDLQADLDAIILKALEKDPERRYQTASDMADDVSRYLAGKPVTAKAPTVLYILRKKISRRWAWAAIGTAAAVALAIGIWTTRPTPEDPTKSRRQILGIRCDLFRDGPTDVAYFQAKEALRRYPDIPEATLVQAHAACLSREKNNATAILTSKIEQDPSPWPYQALLDEIQLPHEPADSDEQESPYWTADLAASADAWYLRSFATLDVHKALVWAREALVRDPEHQLALTCVTYLFEITGEPDSALATADRLIDLNYQTRWPRYKVTLLLNLGRYHEAVDECDRWTIVFPDNYYFFHKRAKLKRRMGKYKDAESDFTAAIDRGGRDDARSAWQYYHRGTVRWMLDREDDAIADYLKAYEFLDEVTYANARLFILLNERGREKEADRMLADSRENANDNPWLKQIFDCLDGKLTPGQLAASAEANGEPAGLCEGYYYAGEAALLDGSIAEARGWFQKCIDTGVKYDPDNTLDTMSEYDLARRRLSR